MPVSRGHSHTGCWKRDTFSLCDAAPTLLHTTEVSLELGQGQGFAPDTQLCPSQPLLCYEASGLGLPKHHCKLWSQQQVAAACCSCEKSAQTNLASLSTCCRHNTIIPTGAPKAPGPSSLPHSPTRDRAEATSTAQEPPRSLSAGRKTTSSGEGQEEARELWHPPSAPTAGPSTSRVPAATLGVPTAGTGWGQHGKEAARGLGELRRFWI